MSDRSIKSKPVSKDQIKVLKATSLREQIYEHLRERIRTGQLTFDDRLVDVDIAAQFGVQVPEWTNKPGKHAISSDIAGRQLETPLKRGDGFEYVSVRVQQCATLTFSERLRQHVERFLMYLFEQAFGPFKFTEKPVGNSQNHASRDEASFP